MAVSATDKEFLNYFTQLDDAQKRSLLEPQSLEQYNQEIEEALAEVAAGNYITQKEMEKEAARW